MFGKFVSVRRFLVASLVMAGVVAASSMQAQDNTKRGRKYKPPPPTAKFEVTVIRASNGKPIENASVIFHPLEDGKNAGNMELKTNEDGKALMDLLDVGSNVRLQIIAPGFQTYGEDYKVDKDNIAIEVKMKKPAEQYSIYKKGEGKPRDANKPADPPKDPPATAPSETKPDAPKDAPKDEAKPQSPPSLL
jgi:hypothetical protein